MFPMSGVGFMGRGKGGAGIYVLDDFTTELAFAHAFTKLKSTAPPYGLRLIVANSTVYDVQWNGDVIDGNSKLFIDNVDSGVTLSEIDIANSGIQRLYSHLDSSGGTYLINSGGVKLNFDDISDWRTVHTRPDSTNQLSLFPQITTTLQPFSWFFRCARRNWSYSNPVYGNTQCFFRGFQANGRMSAGVNFEFPFPQNSETDNWVFTYKGIESTAHKNGALFATGNAGTNAQNSINNSTNQFITFAQVWGKDEMTELEIQKLNTLFS